MAMFWKGIILPKSSAWIRNHFMPILVPEWRAQKYGSTGFMPLEKTLWISACTPTQFYPKKPVSGRAPPIGLNIKNQAVYYLRDTINMIKDRYGEPLKGAKVVRDFYGMCGETWETKPYDDNLLIVGDAAGHASPWMIEGCLQSLIYGRDAGNICIDAISSERYSSKELKNITNSC